MTSTATRTGTENEAILEAVAWNEAGLVPAIAQDCRNKRVLMMAWMNRQALMETVRTGRAVYWSRSRRHLWCKGEQSRCFQKIVDIQLDCDGDTLLLLVEQQGKAACHTGTASCFFRQLQQSQWHIVEQPVRDMQQLYGNSEQ